jgi:hypothetical protein
VPFAFCLPALACLALHVGGTHCIARYSWPLVPVATIALAALPDALRAQTAALVVRHGQGVLALGTPPGGARPAAGQVRLGRLEEVGQKGAAALAVLDQLVRDGDTVRYVDVRVPGSPASR